jgi:6-pyruvoyltetrahydropterin/6-carboxytetrahydropterin synthase
MYSITRRIEIDAGHRIPNHASKCRNLHGHRYVIEATCIADELVSEGASEGMVLDFSFLKEEMVKTIDAYCDHSLILSLKDPLLRVIDPGFLIEQFEGSIDYCYTVSTYGQLYVIEHSPTAEVLAEHWFRRLEMPIRLRSSGLAKLHCLKVYETPNCWAVYPLQLP